MLRIWDLRTDSLAFKNFIPQSYVGFQKKPKGNLTTFWRQLCDELGFQKYFLLLRAAETGDKWRLMETTCPRVTRLPLLQLTATHVHFGCSMLLLECTIWFSQLDFPFLRSFSPSQCGFENVLTLQCLKTDHRFFNFIMYFFILL